MSDNVGYRRITSDFAFALSLGDGQQERATIATVTVSWETGQRKRVTIGTVSSGKAGVSQQAGGPR
jgi:hypothetical protein